MKLMGLVMRCPAISSDGKHVAVYSMAGSPEQGSMTSLAVFGPSGKEEQRIGIVPPATDATKAEAAATKIVKLPVTVTLAAKDGACKKVAAYGIANTQAGYDAKTHLFAFSVEAEEGDAVCHAHDFVVTLK